MRAEAGDSGFVLEASPRANLSAEQALSLRSPSRVGTGGNCSHDGVR